LIEGVRISRRIAAQSPLKELIEGEITPSLEADSDADIAEYIRGHCTTLYHAASTCRMGTDPMAVVDPTSFKVHGLEGLRVADASVIPIMISGNIQTPKVLIAERAAAAIIG
jgi:choline dehydrogenase